MRSRDQFKSGLETGESEDFIEKVIKEKKIFAHFVLINEQYLTINVTFVKLKCSFRYFAVRH